MYHNEKGEPMEHPSYKRPGTPASSQEMKEFNREQKIREYAESISNELKELCKGENGGSVKQIIAAVACMIDPEGALRCPTVRNLLSMIEEEFFYLILNAYKDGMAGNILRYINNSYNRKNGGF